MLNVFVTRKLPESVELRLSELFHTTLAQSTNPITHDALIKALKSADVIIPTLSDILDAQTLDQAGPKLKLIANYGSGYDHIDVQHARSKGILVTNTPSANADDTADMTLALMLAVTRRFKEGAAAMHAGDWRGWSPEAFLGRSIGGKTLGIIGLGRVGRAVASRARAFGMNIFYHNRGQVHAETENALSLTYWSDLHAMLKEVDILAVTCPYTPETYHLLNAETIKLMKSQSIVINTSRGEVVDETALADAIEAGHLMGAGLDVFERDPVTEKRLRDLPNVMMLPHMASATIETRHRMGEDVIRNIKLFENGETPPSVILP